VPDAWTAKTVWWLQLTDAAGLVMRHARLGSTWDQPRSAATHVAERLAGPGHRDLCG